ncbi:Hypothetical protein I595_1118 [Croceitalea dokdonensis DOKDO 023]|uniref:Uncharacterized protein n=1 Tax=Croceitalea dokdonensis DOKDO 023 TaxID=1300341 RepID=A0A0P7ALD6_9FLAO|nr:Hypothetical protein I595_1118 [Croceitalea dokdonensis DOKDO 023]
MLKALWLASAKESTGTQGDPSIHTLFSTIYKNYKKTTA